MKYLIIGDVHGNLPSLLEIVKKAGGVKLYHKIIILGDMVDRGPCSIEILN